MINGFAQETRNAAKLITSSMHFDSLLYLRRTIGAIIKGCARIVAFFWSMIIAGIGSLPIFYAPAYRP